MEDLYSIHPVFSRRSKESGGVGSLVQCCPEFRSPGGAVEPQIHVRPTDMTGSNLPDLMKAQIAAHPRYPSLVSAYIECRKVGAPPEMASLLEEIERENYCSDVVCEETGTDPELDEFMESYCQILTRYKEELSRPFYEAATFLSNIEMQLSKLCNDNNSATSITTNGNSLSDEAGVPSDEDLSCGTVEASEFQEGCFKESERELKEMLRRKYSGYLSSLRKDFLKKRKKGKLPQGARLSLLDWWKTHYRWPYPTEEEKLKLSETTGLDQRQINNWFINQRKRHWKPSEDMRSALLDGVSGGSGTTLYFDTGTVGP